jgi:hypothetical protein
VSKIAVSGFAEAVVPPFGQIGGRTVALEVQATSRP